MPSTSTASTPKERLDEFDKGSSGTGLSFPLKRSSNAKLLLGVSAEFVSEENDAIPQLTTADDVVLNDQLSSPVDISTATVHTKRKSKRSMNSSNGTIEDTFGGESFNASKDNDGHRSHKKKKTKDRSHRKSKKSRPSKMVQDKSKSDSEEIVNVNIMKLQKSRSASEGEKQLSISTCDDSAYRKCSSQRVVGGNRSHLRRVKRRRSLSLHSAECVNDTTTFSEAPTNKSSLPAGVTAHASEDGSSKPYTGRQLNPLEHPKRDLQTLKVTSSNTNKGDNQKLKHSDSPVKILKPTSKSSWGSSDSEFADLENASSVPKERGGPLPPLTSEVVTTICDSPPSSHVSIKSPCHSETAASLSERTDNNATVYSTINVTSANCGSEEIDTGDQKGQRMDYDKNDTDKQCAEIAKSARSRFTSSSVSSRSRYSSHSPRRRKRDRHRRRHHRRRSSSKPSRSYSTDSCSSYRSYRSRSRSSSSQPSTSRSSRSKSRSRTYYSYSSASSPSHRRRRRSRKHAQRRKGKRHSSTRSVSSYSSHSRSTGSRVSNYRHTSSSAASRSSKRRFSSSSSAASCENKKRRSRHKHRRHKSVDSRKRHTSSRGSYTPPACKNPPNFVGQKLSTNAISPPEHRLARLGVGPVGKSINSATAFGTSSVVRENILRPNKEISTIAAAAASEAVRKVTGWSSPAQSPLGVKGGDKSPYADDKCTDGDTQAHDAKPNVLVDIPLPKDEGPAEKEKNSTYIGPQVSPERARKFGLCVTQPHNGEKKSEATGGRLIEKRKIIGNKQATAKRQMLADKTSTPDFVIPPDKVEEYKGIVHSDFIYTLFYLFWATYRCMFNASYHLAVPNEFLVEAVSVTGMWSELNI